MGIDVGKLDLWLAITTSLIVVTSMVVAHTKARLVRDYIAYRAATPEAPTTTSGSIGTRAEVNVMASSSGQLRNDLLSRRRISVNVKGILAEMGGAERS